MISELDTPDAKRYQQQRRQTCSVASVSKDTKIAKAMFSYAVEMGYLDENPFRKAKGGSEVNDSRQHYVTIDDYHAMLSACPDTTWKTIVTLGRIGGLRLPSELVHLKWEDVNWEQNRLIVTSPKTARHGASQRVIPLFPQLREILTEHFEQAEPGSVFVIDQPRYRRPDTNLRTQLLRIIRRAGLPEFPKPGQNLRASCATDVAAHSPIKAATKWLGHSTRVALVHYHPVTDADYTNAIASGPFQCRPEGGAESGAVGCRTVLQRAAIDDTANQRSEDETQETTGPRPTLPPTATPCHPLKMTPTGLEPVLPA